VQFPQEVAKQYELIVPAAALAPGKPDLPAAAIGHGPKLDTGAL